MPLVCGFLALVRLWSMSSTERVVERVEEAEERDAQDQVDDLRVREMLAPSRYPDDRILDGNQHQV